MNPMRSLSTESPTRPLLPDASAEGFAAVSRTALDVLDTLCRAKAVAFRPCGGIEEDPARLRRELLAVLERLGYFPRRRRDIRTDREALELLRDALPTDETSLAMIFLITPL